MNKKLLTLMLAVILITATLISCGKGGEDDADTSDTSDTSSTEAPAMDGTGTDADATGNDPSDGTDPAESGGTETDPTVTDPAGTDPAETSPADTAAPDTDTVITDTSDETTAPDEDVMTSPEVKILRYVALGDSICYGYGLSSPETERYSAIIDGYIDLLQFYECDSYNYGVNGQTSSELLDMLDSGNVPELEGADVVSVSIGANNVLGPAISSLTQYSINMFIEDEAQRAAANAALYEQLTAETDAGIEQFAHDLPLIIDAINKYAPDAQIIFQTIYNPYNNVSLSFDFSTATLDMNETADALVTRLNKIIKDNARSLGYDVADIYTEFENGVGYINADSFGGVDLLTGLDPHPTAEGHRLIADTVCSLIYID